MVEARVRALPGYRPAEDDDAASEGACSSASMLRRLGDVFDLWEDEGEVAAPAAAAGADAEACSPLFNSVARLIETCSNGFMCRLGDKTREG